MNNFLLKDFAKEKVESKKASMKDLLKAFDSSEGSGEEHTSGTFFVIFTVPKKSRKSEEKSQLSTRESPAKSASKKDEKAGKEKKESKGKKTNAPGNNKKGKHVALPKIEETTLD